MEQRFRKRLINVATCSAVTTGGLCYAAIGKLDFAAITVAIICYIVVFPLFLGFLWLYGKAKQLEPKEPFEKKILLAIMRFYFPRAIISARALYTRKKGYRRIA